MITAKEIKEKALRKYPNFLKSLVEGVSFFPLFIPANKKTSHSFAERHKELEQLISGSKQRMGFGYEIKYNTINTRSHGIQDEITSICFDSEHDYTQFINQQKEVAFFKEELHILLAWHPQIKSWLLQKPLYILENKTLWKGIRAVVDFLLQYNVSDYYLRSLPVPVHTKFIKNNQAVIISLLKHFAPEKYNSGETKLENIIGVKIKPLVLPLRWLDAQMANDYSFCVSVIGVTTEGLQKTNWPIQEIWVVENETNLYLIPNRPNAIVIFSYGNAAVLLENISLLTSCRLFYWGDLDEDGFAILDRFRKLYPHTRSVLMDMHTVKFHRANLLKQPNAYRNKTHTQLTNDEQAAYHFLYETNGRIEQEQLQQQFIQAYMAGL